MNTQTANDLRHSITVFSEGSKLRTVIKIRLNDECHNGHEDFAITADVMKQTENGQWIDYMGGCCHDHILELRPDLAPFVALHLSDSTGAPMHCMANAFYWFAGFNNCGQKYHGGSGSSGKSPEECRRIFTDHIRATPEQVNSVVSQSPRSVEELQAILEEMRFPEQWKAEAEAATRQLEEWTGKKFESSATRRNFEPLSQETIAKIKERRESGYYSPEQVAARDKSAKDARREKRLADIRKDHKKSLDKLTKNTAISLLLAEYFEEHNVIFYDHTGELQFNWSNINALHTREEFNAFVEWSSGKLPEGVVCKWQERPSR